MICQSDESGDIYIYCVTFPFCAELVASNVTAKFPFDKRCLCFDYIPHTNYVLEQLDISEPLCYCMHISYLAFSHIAAWFLSNVFGVCDIPFVSDCK